ncbi:MAG TPA: glycosyl hydrolase 53 family protein [Polyangiaceae bacterium]
MRIPFWCCACLVISGCAAIDRSSLGGNSGAAQGGQASAGGSQANAAGFQNSGGSGSAAALDAGGSDAGAHAASFILGADITWVQADSDAGATYSDGTTRDILQILKDHGFNYIRLRTFVDPKASDGYDRTNGYADLSHTIAFAQKIKAAGLGFLLDFHYSDNWADPGKQCVPVAWQGFTNIDQMASALHDYTHDAVSALVAAGARPDMVQIGNEITPGMDIHDCNADGIPTGMNAVTGVVSNWTNLGALLRAGSNAVKEVDPQIQVMLHLDRGNAYQTSHDFIVNARAANVVFDVFGESCYTAYQGQPADWASTFQQLAAAFPDLKLAIAEYGPEQRAANDLLFALPGQQGLGSFNWEPTHGGAWNMGHSLFVDKGTMNTSTPDLLLYDQMKIDYASRL